MGKRDSGVVPGGEKGGLGAGIGNLHAIAFKRKVQCGFCLHAVALGHKLN